ncbi:MAG: hypothetical protein QJR14_06990 [Bacillota bacterium]|nr:hypothetical protein [Bacillota bacterium]
MAVGIGPGGEEPLRLELLDDRSGWLEWQGARLECRLEDGEVRVRLPFQVDRPLLARLLSERGFAVEPDPQGRSDSQAWGLQFDVEGYYPYRVAPAPDHPAATWFSFPPPDYREGGRLLASTEVPGGGYEPILGPGTAAEVKRWLPVLLEARHPY